MLVKRVAVRQFALILSVLKLSILLICGMISHFRKIESPWELFADSRYKDRSKNRLNDKKDSDTSWVN